MKVIAIFDKAGRVKSFGIPNAPQGMKMGLICAKGELQSMVEVEAFEANQLDLVFASASKEITAASAATKKRSVRKKNKTRAKR